MARIKQNIEIAIDAMGGDNAPNIVIEGASIAAKVHKDLKFHFFGDSTKIEPLLDQFPNLKIRSTLTHTDHYVASDEPPASALRSGRQSSMRLAINAVQEGLADGVVSAGNTGALMAISKFVFKTLRGVTRPAIAGLMPKKHSKAVMLDLGANSECTPKNLVEFAMMGGVFAKILLHKKTPTIGLLNIGSESIKGNEIVKHTDELLSPLILPGRYIGYVEGNALNDEAVDVIVTDGFTGNVSLKMAEGIAQVFGYWVKSAFTRNIVSKFIALLFKPVLKSLFKNLDPRSYNGAMFLGLKHICVKSHGGTDALGFSYAILACRELIEKEIITRLSDVFDAHLDALENMV